MFSKKCKKCNKKFSKKYEFCPFCGFDSKEAEDAREYGLLGKDDFLESKEFNELKLPFGMKSLMKLLPKLIEKSIKEIEKQERASKDTPEGFNVFTTPNSIKINFSSINGQPITKVRETTNRESQGEITGKNISEEKARKISQLPKKEAKTRVRRLSNKIVYEIKVPGVKSLDNVIINKLEDSIEIKAISEKVVYLKNININLPILRYILKQENIILELKAKN